jgi:succinate-semialdehyde dehydrogenase/glutarate-semialdehyde dehydrogenase
MAIATINPTTGQTIKTFDSLTDAQVDQKLQKAIDTFRQFRKLSFADRARMMVRAGKFSRVKKIPWPIS